MNLACPNDWKVPELKVRDLISKISEDVPDLFNIQDLENSLRCSICYEYFQTTMMLPCSHNFCSLCIRRHLEYTGNKACCPLCSKPSVAAELVNNRLIDDLVKQFSAIRSKLLKLENALCSSGGDNKTATAFTAQSHETTITRPLGMRLDMCEETFPPKQPLAPANSLADKGSAQLSRHHSEQLNKTGWKESILSGNEHVSKPTKEEMSESKQKNSDKKGSSNTQGEQVCCPVCQTMISSQHINAHLDRCLSEQSGQKQHVRGSNYSCNGLSAQSGTKRLPKLIYTPSLLPDKELNRKLTELSLPVTGNRQTRVKRHQEFTLMYNAECDKENPRTKKQLAKEFLQAETEKVKAGGDSTTAETRNQGESEKQQKARATYIREHNGSFKKLVDEIQSRKPKNSTTRQLADLSGNDKKSSITTPQSETRPNNGLVQGSCGFLVDEEESDDFEEGNLLPSVTRSHSCRRRINSSGSSHSPADSDDKPGLSADLLISSMPMGSDDDMPSQSILDLTGNDDKEEMAVDVADERGQLTGGQKLLQDAPPDNLTQLLSDEITSIPESPTSFSPLRWRSPHHPKPKKDDFQPCANLLSSDSEPEEPAPKRRSLRTRRNPKRSARYTPQK